MDPKLFGMLIFLGYLVVVLAGGLGCIGFLRARRRTKWPFKESEKLLRGPGETLRRRIAKLDEDEFPKILFSSALAPLLGFGVVYIASRLRLSGVFCVVSASTVLAVGIVVNAWWLVRLWKQRSALFLGWFGERMTADYLRPLQRAGYHVFHDFPAEVGKKGFNIDHIVVGPSGVTIVETKTRRKYKGSGGHEVTFDGRQLVWPWGAESKCLQQTTNEAEWLARWLRERLGDTLPIRKVISIPGWFVHETPGADIRVVNPKIIADVIRSRGEGALAPKQIDLIARQIEARCRDVEE